MLPLSLKKILTGKTSGNRYLNILTSKPFNTNILLNVSFKKMENQKGLSYKCFRLVKKSGFRKIYYFDKKRILFLLEKNLFPTLNSNKYKFTIYRNIWGEGIAYLTRQIGVNGAIT